METREQDKDKLAHAREQAESQYQGIVELVAALECDYDRLEELREELNDLQTALDDTDDTDEKEAAQTAMDEWQSSNMPELMELITAAGECESQEDAQTRIQEDPLSVEVRSGWVCPGDKMEAVDFNILLCTGGPAVRIRGELGLHDEPRRAWIEYQDWYTPWTEYYGAQQDVLLTYARQFFYGE